MTIPWRVRCLKQPFFSEPSHEISFFVNGDAFFLNVICLFFFSGGKSPVEYFLEAAWMTQHSSGLERLCEHARFEKKGPREFGPCFFFRFLFRNPKKGLNDHHSAQRSAFALSSPAQLPD